MKHLTLYLAVAFTAFTSPLVAAPITDEEPGFWSNLFNLVLDSLTPVKLTPDNCDLCHTNGILYVNYYDGSGSHTSFKASAVKVSESGSVYYESYNSSDPIASPFGIIPLMNHDKVHVDYDGFKHCLMLERAGQVTPVKGVYSDGEKVYVKVNESFGTYDAHHYLYFNADMISWDQGVFYIDLLHKGTIHRFSPAAIDIDGNFMYVSKAENNLYVDAFGSFCMGSSVPATTLPSYTAIALAHELQWVNDTLVVYQNGALYYPYSIYAGGNCFFFD